MSYFVQIFVKCIIAYLVSSKHMLCVLAKDMAHNSVQFGQSFGLFKFDPSNLPLHQRQHALINILTKRNRISRSSPDTHGHAHGRALGGLPTLRGNKLTTIANRIVRSTPSGFNYPYQTTVIIRNPTLDPTDQSMDVYIGPQARVLAALMDATRQYTRTYGNRGNPYNVSLQWDEELQCYVVNASLGLQNTSWQKWRVTVESREQEIVYDGRCLPRDVILTPDSTVIISFLPTLVDI